MFYLIPLLDSASCFQRSDNDVGALTRAALHSFPYSYSHRGSSDNWPNKHIMRGVLTEVSADSLLTYNVNRNAPVPRQSCTPRNRRAPLSRMEEAMDTALPP